MNETAPPLLDADAAFGNLAPLEHGLQQRFAEHRIVFWDDEDGEFAAALASLSLPGITVLRLDETPALAVKIRLEIEDPQGRYLLYAPYAAPPESADWLLDIREYSAVFQADRASILLDELGLGESQALRGHINARRKFFKSQDRTNRLAKLTAPTDSASDLDRKMLAVLARPDSPEAFNLVVVLFHDMAREGHALDALPSCWEDAERFDLLPSFWQLIAQSFGYQDENPSLRNLLIRLLASDFARNCPAGKIPDAFSHLVVPTAFWPNVAVCLNQWRDSSSRGASYARLSGEAARALNLRDVLVKFSPEELADSMTFLEEEKHIIAELRDRVIHLSGAGEHDAIQALIASRRVGHWASSNFASDEVPGAALRAAYQALEAAAALLLAVQPHATGFSFAGPQAAYRAYENELFQIDQHYRHFCEYSHAVRLEGWDLLKTLCEKIEAAYGTGFLAKLGLAWSELVENDLLAKWQIEGVPNQYQFFQSQVKSVLNAGEIKRVFVIISDAFRFETAQELTTKLNGNYRIQATLSSQLGVLPSYTPLGMASLLPHNTLSYHVKGDAVLVDGRSTAGMENRDKILKSVQGLAVGADELTKMNRDTGRAFLKDAQIVYIYHDAIDTAGEKASSEDDTFAAARTAIEEIEKLVHYIINRFNGTLIVVTADHGFLYQETRPDETQKSALEEKPAGTLVAKKRYLVGHDLPRHEKTHRGSTAITARTAPTNGRAMEFYVPRSVNRFHFAGGARYLHGGAMPQEIVVPIIQVREKEGKSAQSTKVRSVKVHFVGTRTRITTNRYGVQLIQTESVSQRVQAVTLQVGIYDGETPISSLETVTFDSTSSEMHERSKTVMLSLQSGEYDKKKSYHILLRKADDKIEVQRIAVSIDLAFSADF